MKFSDWFSRRRPPEPKEELQEYSYNEFLLDLPSHWRPIPTAEEGAVNFQSDTEGAAIILSIDFYQIPDSKAQAMAEQCVKSRIEAHEQVAPGRVQVLHRSIKPHSGGVGLELSYAAEVPGEHVYLYLGYVTSRKILNFTLVCQPDRVAAGELFNKTMESFRPKLP